MKKPAMTLVLAVSGLLLSAGISAAAKHHRDDEGSKFSNSDFRGTYAESFHGTVVGTGVLTADGAGNLTSGTQTVNNGTNVCVGSLTGTYSVNPDGTGTLTTEFTTTKTVLGACPVSAVMRTFAIVIQSRRRISTSEDDAGLLVAGQLSKQHRDNRED